jgi:hypothetical protein
VFREGGGTHLILLAKKVQNCGADAAVPEVSALEKGSHVF